jgi:hypothetical protein
VSARTSRRDTAQQAFGRKILVDRRPMDPITGTHALQSRRCFGAAEKGVDKLNGYSG